MSNLFAFALISILALRAYAEIRIPLFGGSITIHNNSDGSFSVGTEKKTAHNTEKHTSFTVRNGTIENFEFTNNSTHSNKPATSTTTEKPMTNEFHRKRPSQQRPKSDVLNALLSMFGRF